MNMENFEEIKPELNENEEQPVLWISEDIRSFIYDTSKWTRLLAIVGFVTSALIAISALSVGAVLNTLSATNPANPMLQMNPLFLTLAYLIFALITFYPSYLLLKFSTSAKQAVLYADQPSLHTAMAKLKSFFKFYGVLTIIGIAIYGLAIIAMIAFGLSAQGG